MQRLSVTLSDDSVWDAVSCPKHTKSTEHIILQNFRVVPFDSVKLVRLRIDDCEKGLRLCRGTYVGVDGCHRGVVVSSKDATCPMISIRDKAPCKVSIDRLTYRMGVSIDDLDKVHVNDVKMLPDRYCPCAESKYLVCKHWKQRCSTFDARDDAPQTTKSTESEQEDEKQVVVTGATAYETLPWKRTSVPGGLLLHPRDNGSDAPPVLFGDIPTGITEALGRIIQRLSCGVHHKQFFEMTYKNVSLYRGRQGAQFLFKGWQVQRQFPGSAGYIGRAWESKLAALMVAASYVDPTRLNTLASMHSWILWLIEGGTAHADTWLHEVQAALSMQESFDIRPHGGRKVDKNSDTQRMLSKLPFHAVVPVHIPTKKRGRDEDTKQENLSIFIEEVD